MKTVPFSSTLSLPEKYYDKYESGMEVSYYFFTCKV